MDYLSDTARGLISGKPKYWEYRLLGLLVGAEGLKLTKTSDALYQSVYDYNIVYVRDSSFEADMRAMGNEGWEIVSA